jgi:hypothetical protein
MAVDDSGNKFVDFVWGNLPMQPSYDEGDRPDSGPQVIVAPNAAQNKGWTGYTVYPSGYLSALQTVELNNGIVQVDNQADSHDIATLLWSNYPEFTENVGYQD